MEGSHYPHPYGYGNASATAALLHCEGGFEFGNSVADQVGDATRWQDDLVVAWRQVLRGVEVEDAPIGAVCPGESLSTNGSDNEARRVDRSQLDVVGEGNPDTRLSRHPHRLVTRDDRVDDGWIGVRHRRVHADDGSAVRVLIVAHHEQRADGDRELIVVDCRGLPGLNVEPTPDAPFEGHLLGIGDVDLRCAAIGT